MNLSCEGRSRWFKVFAGFGRLFACSCFLLPVRAQYVIDTWTTENGLPQNSILSIRQTPDGYLWFTTFDGLVRFDGIHFAVFNKINTAEITSNRFIHLFSEADGALWASTEDSGVVRYRDGHFRAFTTANGLPSNYVVQVQRDVDGSLRFDTDAGAAHLRNGRMVVDQPYGSTQGRTYLSPRGHRWELNRTGLCETADARKLCVPLQFSASEDFRHVYLDETPDGVLWVAGKGIFYRLASGVVTAYSPRDGYPRSWIHDLSHDREGHPWLATSEEGACRFADGRFTCYKAADGLSSNFASSLLLDREGSMWVGTADRGLNRFTRRVVTSLSTAAGLPDKNVYPVLADRNGDVWVGAIRGLARIHAGRVVQFFGQSEGLTHEDVQALYEDRASRLWIGSANGVAYYAGGRFVDFTSTLGLNESYSCYFIHEDAGGTLWFGTNHGLVAYHDGHSRRYTQADGLPGEDVKVVHESPDGTLWMGTYGGLARLEGQHFFAYTEQDGLASNHVRALYENPQGTLWIGTYDGGLSRLHDSKFTNYTTAQGLFSNGVFKILEDAHDNFWMSSNQGIFRVSRRQLEDVASGQIPAVVSTAFGKSDGMLNSECNGGREQAGTRTADGKLWFPTQDGLAVIDPEALPHNPLPPSVVIESGSVRGREVPLADGWRLKSSEGSLEIRYTGLSLLKSDQVRFRFRLETLDTGWVEAGTRRAAYYPYLPPGHYVFRVIACNSDLVWNEQGATLAIVILPPFYRTWWFIGVNCVGMLVVASIMWKRRVRQLERAHAVQLAFSRQLIESREREHQRMAAELHDSLGQHLLIIKNRAVLGTRAAGNQPSAKEQFDEITASASQAIDEVRQIAYNLRPLNLERLGLTVVLEELVEKVASTSGIQFSADVIPLDGLLAADNAINLYRIIQESVNNIVKHAQATKAAVEIWSEGGDVRVTIADNGRGFDPDAPPRSGMGLTSISERVRMLGGTHTVFSKPGQGTILTIRFPAGDCGKRTPNGV